MPYRSRKQRYDVPIEIPEFNPLESPMEQRAREGVGVHGLPPWAGLAGTVFLGAANYGTKLTQDAFEFTKRAGRSKRRKVGRKSYGSKNYANGNPQKPQMYRTK